MATPLFTPANLAIHREALIELNVEYFIWMAGEGEAAFGIKAEDGLGMPIPEYVAGALDKICGDTPPRGIFYLVEHDQQPAGMGGLRWVAPGIAEVKRMYIRPVYRGAGLGSALLERLLADAQAFGYQHIRLDSAPFMRSAHRLYEAAGFVDRASYLETEVPAFMHPMWRFMEKSF